MLRFATIGLAVIVFLTAGLAAHADIPVTKEAANDYYKRCTEADDPRMSREAQESLCSCVSANMMISMTMDQMERMTTYPGPGRKHFNDMLVNVYAPCMQDAVEEAFFSQCVKDKTIQEFSLNSNGLENLCACVAVKTGKTLLEEGPRILNYMLSKRPDITDPFTPMIEDPDFRRRAYDQVYTCLEGR